MTRKLEPLPIFKNEAEERTFWETHDSTGYVDWSRAERAQFPNLKPSTKPTLQQNVSSPHVHQFHPVHPT